MRNYHLEKPIGSCFQASCPFW